MEINGKGIGEYRKAFRTKRIKLDDNLFVQNNSLEHYVIMGNGTLTWGNRFEKQKAEKFSVGQILSRKNWYVKID